VGVSGRQEGAVHPVRGVRNPLPRQQIKAHGGPGDWVFHTVFIDYRRIPVRQRPWVIKTTGLFTTDVLGGIIEVEEVPAVSKCCVRAAHSLVGGGGLL